MFWTVGSSNSWVNFWRNVGYSSMKGIFWILLGSLDVCFVHLFIRSTLPPEIWCRFDIISFPSWPYSKTPHEVLVGPNSFWRLLREMFENSTGQKYSCTTKGVKKAEVICTHIYIYTHLNKTLTYTHCNYLRNIMVLVHSWESLRKLLNPYEPCLQHFVGIFFEVCYGLDEKNLLRKCSKYWRSYKYWSIRNAHPIP